MCVCLSVCVCCACVCVRVCDVVHKMFKALPALDKQNEKKIEILRKTNVMLAFKHFSLNQIISVYLQLLW